jgi:hypothetical protein
MSTRPSIEGKRSNGRGHETDHQSYGSFVSFADPDGNG